MKWSRVQCGLHAFAAKMATFKISAIIAEELALSKSGNFWVLLLLLWPFRQFISWHEHPTSQESHWISINFLFWNHYVHEKWILKKNPLINVRRFQSQSTLCLWVYSFETFYQSHVNFWSITWLNKIEWEYCCLYPFFLKITINAFQ